MRTMSGIGRSIGAAVTGNRRLEDFEYAPLFTFGALLLFLSFLVFWWPRGFSWPLAVLGGWIAFSFILEGASLWWHRRAK